MGLEGHPRSKEPDLGRQAAGLPTPTPHLLSNCRAVLEKLEIRGIFISHLKKNSSHTCYLITASQHSCKRLPQFFKGKENEPQSCRDFPESCCSSQSGLESSQNAPSLLLGGHKEKLIQDEWKWILGTRLCPPNLSLH